MPYSKEHKEKTREKILESAYALFSTRGFDAVTVNDVMEDCSLTRGGFYAHFDSKSALYSEAIAFASAQSDLARGKLQGIPSREWLESLLDAYLSVEHVKGERACPLAFLVTDVASRGARTRSAYTQAYTGMNAIILQHANVDNTVSYKEALSLSAMIIGAVAVARTIDDRKLVEDILASARQQANRILGW